MKKGFFYTISIFLFTLVLLELLAFSVEQRSRVRADTSVMADPEALESSLSTMSFLSLQTLGINVSAYRDASNLSISVSDAGFPFSNPSAGAVNSTALNSHLSSFASASGISLIADYSVINTTGIVLSSDSGVNYTQNNSASSSANATLRMPPYSPTLLMPRVICSLPKANAVSFSQWSIPSSSSARIDSIFSSVSPSGSSARSNAADFSSNGTMLASYSSGANWLANVTLGWETNSSGRAFFIINSLNSSAGVVQADLNCTWNVTIDENYASAASVPLRIYIPIETNATYRNANYFGNLTVLRA